MTTEENKLFMTRFVEETINKKNLDAIDELVAEGADGFTILLHVGDDEDLLHPTLALLAHMFDGFTEVPREAHLVVVGDALATKYEDTAVEQRLLSLLEQPMAFGHALRAGRSGVERLRADTP